MNFKLLVAVAKNAGSGVSLIFKFDQEVPEYSKITQETITVLVENIKEVDALLVLQKALEKTVDYVGSENMPTKYDVGNGVNKKVSYPFSADNADKIEGLVATLKVWMNEGASGGVHFPGNTEMVQTAENQVAVDAIAAIKED
jgi:hypothetical protein